MPGHPRHAEATERIGTAMTGAQVWASPKSTEGTRAENAPPGVAAYPPVSWWFVSWRARELDESTGDITARLSAVADAMEQLRTVGNRPAIRALGGRHLVFEFWFEAASSREAAGGARSAMRHGFRSAGVGDPTSPPGTDASDVALILEELPTLVRNES
jgi:hypothetical protein